MLKKAFKIRACAESKILRQFERLKVTQQSRFLPFTFSPPLIFRFSCLVFQFFLMLDINFTGLQFGVFVTWRGGGRVFGNTFRIIGFDGIKCGWVVEQDSHQSGVLGSTLHFVPRLYWRNLGSFGYAYGLKDLLALQQVRGQSCLWLLKLVMLQGIRGTLICLTCDQAFFSQRKGKKDGLIGGWDLLGSHRQCRGEWVSSFQHEDILCSRHGLICSKLCNFSGKGFSQNSLYRRQH